MQLALSFVLPLSIAISFSSLALAAINPADPGLADASAYGQSSIPNNGASAMCVECHTYNPAAADNHDAYGSHFILNEAYGLLRETNSGGGWEGGYWDIRNGGEFFKITAWDYWQGGNGGSSKYGDIDEWESVVYLGDGELLGTEAALVETSPYEMASLEMICESCHSIRVNVLGRYNLLARTVNTDVMDDSVGGSVADLCVGCHGFLYHDDQGLANSQNLNWSDPRNIAETTGGMRGNNEVHSIRGMPYPRNHHVMSGDAIDHPLAQAGLLMRDVSILSPELVSVPISFDSRKGMMPIRLEILPPFTRPANVNNLHCLSCHVPAHGGEPSMGAAILRGEGMLGRDLGSGMDRISDGKEWGRFNDAGFCMKCHE